MIRCKPHTITIDVVVVATKLFVVFRRGLLIFLAALAVFGFACHHVSCLLKREPGGARMHAVDGID
jgi:hypothetical protein